MTEQENAYAEIEKFDRRFKNMSAAKRRKMNEIQTRLGFL
jgi:hypothetical protein